MEIGTVLATTLSVNRDGVTPVRLATCTVSGPTDIRTVQMIGNIDHNPVTGAKVLILEVESAWEVGIVLEDIAAAALTVVGDKVLAANVAGTGATAFVACRATGMIELNGTSDTAVAYAQMKIAFDQLKADFNAHVHSVMCGGVTVAAIAEFAQLKIAFDQLKTDFNNLVDFINGTSPVGHVHTCPVGGGPTTAMTGAGVKTTADMAGATSTVLPPNPPSAADMSPANVSTVKVALP